MKKILVVDDDKHLLKIMGSMLTHHNFVVKTTSKWQHIAKTIKNFTPDLILLDIDLRGADGGDICKKLKQSKETQKVPVVLLSVIMPEDYTKQCNAQGFLIKPFLTSDVVDIVKQNLD